MATTRVVALSYSAGMLTLLDQRALPEKEVIVETRDWREVVAAIQVLAVRGAPLIGAAGAYAACLAAREFFARERFDALGRLDAALETIAQARPTAVNLAGGIDRLRAALEREGEKLTRHAAARKTRIGVRSTPRRAASPSLEITPVRTIAVLETEAEMIAGEDRAACARIGAHGAGALAKGMRRPLRVLTHCNAGALATCGIGTALGVVRELHAHGKLERVFADETRPLGQGARLTAWELLRDGIPVTVQTDSMAGSLLASGKIDAVVVGADRIARNGDAANKIGTLPLAVVARHYGVPFYVAAPTSTLDPQCPDGRKIPIELRAPDEISAAPGAVIHNPAFDVTPAGLITAIITERGAHSPKEIAGICETL